LLYVYWSSWWTVGAKDLRGHRRHIPPDSCSVSEDVRAADCDSVEG